MPLPTSWRRLKKQGQNNKRIRPLKLLNIREPLPFPIHSREIKRYTFQWKTHWIAFKVLDRDNGPSRFPPSNAHKFNEKKRIPVRITSYYISFPPNGKFFGKIRMFCYHHYRPTAAMKNLKK